MKKIITILTILSALLFFSPSAIYAGLNQDCNSTPNSLVSYQKTETQSQVKIHLETTNTNPNLIRIEVSTKCDNNIIQGPTDLNQSLDITLSKKDLVGSCSVSIQGKELDPMSVGEVDSNQSCSIPIQTIFITGNYKIAGNKLYIPVNLPLTSDYYVETACSCGNSDPTACLYDQSSNYRASYLQYNSTNKTATFIWNNPPPLEDPNYSCSSLNLYVKGRKVGTLEDALNQYDQQQVKKTANTPCKFIDPSSPEYNDCVACMGDINSPSGKVWTVFGCMNTTGTGGLFSTIFRILSFLLGGVAMLLLVYASFLYITSQGDAEKIKQAKSLLTAIIAGILFIIFSIMIMKFVGLTLLDLPTLKTSSFSGGNNTPGGGSGGGGGGFGGDSTPTSIPTPTLSFTPTPTPTIIYPPTLTPTPIPTPYTPPPTPTQVPSPTLTPTPTT
ncbi:MAG: hypothetical protein GXP43_02955 [bacterium]|nr:hypothetical protein [bacterium]